MLSKFTALIGHLEYSSTCWRQANLLLIFFMNIVNRKRISTKKNFYVHRALGHSHVQAIEYDVGIAFGAVSLVRSPDADGVLSTRLQSGHLDLELPPAEFQVARALGHLGLCCNKSRIC